MQYNTPRRDAKPPAPGREVLRALEILRYSEDRLLLIVLNAFPITGPRSRRTAKTTMATRTRINAYSTSPCPFGAIRIFTNFTSFPLKIQKL
ncbi:MAG: hypothetical protein PGMFKBFP_01996 [Anaerolineales bacterium]|nr:hypothetical protein [Anaerolineales bacterium]